MPRAKQNPEMSGECPEQLRGLHMNGMPCEDLDAAVWRILTADRTDEAIEEARQGAGSARVSRGAVEKRMDERRGGLSSGMQPWEAPDILKEAADRHVAPGMRAKFLSKSRVDREGGNMRGYEVVQGEKGPVVVGDLVLAQMPEEKANQRNAFYLEKARKVQRMSDEERARAVSENLTTGVRFRNAAGGGGNDGEDIDSDQIGSGFRSGNSQTLDA